MCILLNTIILGFDTYPENEELDRITLKINLVFFTIFVVEIVIKLLGLGFSEYIKDKFNIFDFVIIIMSAADLIISMTPLSS